MPTRMIGSRSVDRIRAAVKSTANAVHMSAPAEEHHPSKKTLQQGSHPHMPLCFVVPSGKHVCDLWVVERRRSAPACGARNQCRSAAREVERGNGMGSTQP